MKKFLIKIAIFAVVLYGLAWGLDYAISKGLYQMDDYRFISWREIGEGNINADILIMGNSRALSHFEPWTIDSITGMSCYNIGLGGYPINVERMKCNYYRLHNTKPKMIILQVDYLTLNCTTASHKHQSEQYLPLTYDHGMRHELRNVGYSWLDVSCPLYRYWGYQMVIKNGLIEIIGLKHYVCDPSCRGLHYERGAWNGTELANMDTIPSNVTEEGKYCLGQFMQQCADDNIKVILVNSPMFIEATNKTVGLDAVNTYLDSMATAYNTEYWDYTHDELCYDTANFVVSIHMNPMATHKFSMDVANKLKNEGLTQ